VLSPLSYILVLLAMKSAPISLVAPLREVSILFAAALGGMLLGERMTPQRIACAVAMFVGVALIAMR
jgi:drug/metabolite transporter (DMT)-like permease